MVHIGAGPQVDVSEVLACGANARSPATKETETITSRTKGNSWDICEGVNGLPSLLVRRANLGTPRDGKHAVAAFDVDSE